MVENNKASTTKNEKEILYLLTTEYLTPKKISIRRQTSVQAVYKIIKKLKQKGLINKTYERVEKNRPTKQPLGLKMIRLHGQEFNIQILWKDKKRYDGLRVKGNLLSIDNNTVRLYNNSIEIYSGQNFYADDVQKATARSLVYWNRFITRLEDTLNVILIKPRKHNIRLINSHYAETGNELSGSCRESGDKIRVYTTEDSKLWFVIDNSFNLEEAETLHPETSKHDMQDVVKPFFNDLRDHNPPKLSEIMVMIKEVISINKETASGLNSVVEMLKPKQRPQEDDDSVSKVRPEYIG